MSPKISPKTVLITGCTDNSIGSGLSKAFAARGLRVFAAARSTSSMSSLAAVPNVTLLELDVTSPESIAAAVKTISSETGGTLDYLFNNAGVVYRSAAVETDDRMARRLFDVNFWGVVDMCRAFAHLVVEAKGTIINHGSLNARVSLPWSSMYSASKAAMESYSDILRLEMAPFGVKVVTVISGAVETNMNSATSLAPSTLPAEDSIFKPAESNIAKPFIRDRMSVETYSQRVVNDILSGNTSRVWRGAFASRLWFATTFLPTSLVDAFVVMNQGLELLGKK